MTRPRLILAAFLIFGLASAACRGCGTPASRSGSTQRGGQLVASMRVEPRSFNRLVDARIQPEIIAGLTLARLVRVNRATFELEPWLAEKWDTSADGRLFTLHLRKNIVWSDGVPFTSADVVFSFEAVFDPRAESVLASSLTIGGQPIRARAVDASTVAVTYPGPSGPGIRLLDDLWIVPKHKLEPALRAGTFRSAWNTSTPPGEMAAIGPFMLRAYQPGQRLVFERNPHYWRKAPDGGQLPYLDRVVLEIVGDQDAEMLRLTSGDIDMVQDQLRPDDYGGVKRAADQGRLSLIELGIGTDADSFWFCLNPSTKKGDPRLGFVQKREFRQAISHAVNRRQFADVVYLGAAVPIWGPVTPGNKVWHWPDVPRYDYDVERAKTLLRTIGLEDRNGNETVEDAKGTEARFTVITQQGISWYGRATAFLRDELAKIGITLDIAPLEGGAMIQKMLAGEYDAIYYRFLTTDVDPALSKDFWLSAGVAHVWNIGQKTPATEWERRIDTLMLEQAATSGMTRRRELFNHVQRILAENLPIIHFVAPRFYYAQSARVHGAMPSVLRPPVLWSPDMLSLSGVPNRSGR